MQERTSEVTVAVQVEPTTPVSVAACKGGSLTRSVVDCPHFFRPLISFDNIFLLANGFSFNRDARPVFRCCNFRLQLLFSVSICTTVFPVYESTTKLDVSVMCSKVVYCE